MPESDYDAPPGIDAVMAHRFRYEHDHVLWNTEGVGTAYNPYEYQRGITSCSHAEPTPAPICLRPAALTDRWVETENS